MLWVMLLHISALLFWCATLLYLPLLAIGHGARGADKDLTHGPRAALERLLFTHLATPAALATIISGTLLFVLNRTVDGWLIVKLTLVTGLATCHIVTGLLVWRVEATARGAPAGRFLPLWGRLLGLTTVALIAAIVWVVLAKPSRIWLW